MRTAVLTIILSSVLAMLCAMPACGQQEWSRPKPSSSAGKPATPKEMLTRRLQQLREEKQHKEEVQLTPEAVVSAAQSQTSEPQPPGSSGIQQARFEVTVEPPVAAPPADLKSPISKSAAPLFLDLTQDETAVVASDERTAENAGKAEVTLASSPIQVLMRAVAWIVIALCLCSLTFLGLRRWQRQRGLLPTTNAKCKVLETLSLGPGRTVSLIEMAGFRALVASDAGGIRSLVLAPSNFHEELMVADHAGESDLTSVKFPATA